MQGQFVGTYNCILFLHSCRDISYLTSWSYPCKLAWISMRGNSDYIGLMALFYTDCLFKPRAGMILFYGRIFHVAKSLF